MSNSLIDLKTAASGLSNEERADLADYLHSLDEVEEDEIRQEWLEEAEERMAEVEAGLEEGISAEEVHANLRGLLR